MAEEVMDLYDIARQVTDEVMGEGSYDELNKDHPDPGVQAAIKRGAMKLEWKEQPTFLEVAVPVKKPVGHRTQVLITIEERPPYCDRGRFIAKCWSDPADGLPLDAQEGWPRYYFDLEVAKSEIQAWVDVRLR